MHHTLIYRLIDIVGRAFTNGQGDRGSISDRIMPKTQKMVLDASLLKIEHYTVLIKDKRSNPGKRVAPSHQTLMLVY